MIPSGERMAACVSIIGRDCFNDVAYGKIVTIDSIGRSYDVILFYQTSKVDYVRDSVYLT